MNGRLVFAALALFAGASSAPAQVPPRGTIVDQVPCVDDVSAEAGRLAQMSRQSDVKKALERQRDADDAEGRAMAEIFELEARLGEDERRNLALITLRDRLAKLSRTAAAEAVSPERGQARRVLRSIAAGAPTRVQDREYLDLLAQYRPAR